MEQRRRIETPPNIGSKEQESVWDFRIRVDWDLRKAQASTIISVLENQKVIEKRTDLSIWC
jgi:hypothetical protein